MMSPLNAQLKMPQDACPNDGVCLLVLPRLKEHESRLDKHDAALERIGKVIDATKTEVHDVNTTLSARDDTMKFFRNAFLSILLVGLTQLAASIWWASNITRVVEEGTMRLADHESRLRIEERLSGKFHQEP